jgi:uncharacterized membrane protein YgcG
MSLGFDECKVFISNVDSQSSAEGGILVQVLGEMSNKNGPWRKFAQTFFLAEQPNGYFVLNDVFRYIKEDNDEEVSEPSAPQTPAKSQQEPAPAAPRAAEAPAPQINGIHPAKGEETKPAAPVSGQQTVVSLGKSEPTQLTAAVASTAQHVAEAPPPADDAVSQPAPSAPVESKVPTPSAAADQADGEPAAPVPAVETTPAPATDLPASEAPSASSAPRSWASLAASGSRQWGPAASSAAGVVASVTPSSSTGAERSGATSPANSGQQQHRTRPPRFDPTSISTGHVFIKHVVESITDDALRKTLTQRFGPINSLHIARSKACAFLEFASVDSARKAIQACQRQEFGGEGGIQVSGEWVHLEKKKDGAERPPPTNRGRGSGERGGRGGGGSGRGSYSRGGENRDSSGGADRSSGGEDSGRGRGGAKQAASTK